MKGHNLLANPIFDAFVFLLYAGKRSGRQAGRALLITAAVSLEVEPAPNNARRLYAGVNIAAPVQVVWDALTDYDGLGNFIPGACRAPQRHTLLGQHCSPAPSCMMPGC